jgi:hypothetical protein
VPVLVFETETDLTFLAYTSARQDDSKNFRLWEVAGTSHADSYLTGGGMNDLGTSPESWPSTHRRRRSRACSTAAPRSTPAHSTSS